MAEQKEEVAKEMEEEAGEMEEEAGEMEEDAGNRVGEEEEDEAEEAVQIPELEKKGKIQWVTERWYNC